MVLGVREWVTGRKMKAMGDRSAHPEGCHTDPLHTDLCVRVHLTAA